MSQNNISASSFTGQWIGATQGIDMKAHLWEITQQGAYLMLATKWEGETKAAHFYAEMIPGEAAFRILHVQYGDKAVLIDSQHFVIRDWVWGRDDMGQEQRYDVIFSRPGIAELTARAAYLKSLNSNGHG